MNDTVNVREEENKDSLIKRMLRRLRPSTRKELADVIAEAGSRDVIDEDTEDMLKGVFDISRLRVSDIMIPRSEMVTLDSELGVKEAVEVIASSGHSRYPVSEEDRDHIIGILNAKDLLPYACALKEPLKSIADIVRPCTVVPETLRVDAMLKHFQENHLHIAVVVDEFGGVCGLITIEDILELIVGDIADEYDTEEEDAPPIVKVGENTWEMEGVTLISDFNDYFKADLPSPDVDTVAGLVIHCIGHIPAVNEEARIGRFIFKVLEASHHQVTRLSLTQVKDIKDSAS